MRSNRAVTLALAFLGGCTSSTIVPGGQLQTASVAYQVDDRGAGDKVSVVICHRLASPPCVVSRAVEMSADELREWMKDAELRSIRLSEQHRQRTEKSSPAAEETESP